MEGRGVLQLRARAGIDRIGRGTQERDAIIKFAHFSRKHRRGKFKSFCILPDWSRIAKGIVSALPLSHDFTFASISPFT